MKVRSAELVRSAFHPREFVRDGRKTVAFVGRSNVGKSSLLNRLLGGRKLAHTSSTPGRTRSVNYFLINESFYFVDLPGYGYAKAGRSERRRWGEVAERFFREGSRGGQVVLLVDSYVGATPLDVQAHLFLREQEAEIILAATKADRLAKSRRQQSRREIRTTLGLSEETPLFSVSARTGEGLRELWREILSDPAKGDHEVRKR